MGFIGSLFGGGKKAMMAQLDTPTTVGQANAAYDTSKSALQQQQDFLHALQAQGGLGNQANVYNQMQGLAGQFQNVANGAGPNPALAQLNNTTGQNIANQAAMMAGQRGSGQNVGLMARQIGNQGANLQQQAAGQGAALQAQQQLAGLNALQGQQGMLGNMANTQVSNQGSALSGYNQYAQNEQNQILNAINQQNQARIGNVSQANAANASMQNNSNNLGGKLFGGLANAIGGAGSFLSNLGGGDSPSPGAGGSAQSAMKNLMFAADGGQVPTSSVGKYLSGAMNMKTGGTVPGQAPVMGDSRKNDTVPAMLSPKEIVLPRSVTMHENAPEKAAAFVEAILNKQKLRKPS